MSELKWICYAWEGNTSNYTKDIIQSNHIYHAEMKLINHLQLKGI